MSWLKDIEEKRRKVLEAQTRLENEQKHKNEEYELEFQQHTPLVEKLLRELGHAWWGKSAHLTIDNEEIDYEAVFDDPFCCNGWCLRKSDAEYPYWGVYLRKELQFFFKVRSHGKNINTVDTSEEELKRVLRKAAENGPIERADDENLRN